MSAEPIPGQSVFLGSPPIPTGIPLPGCAALPLCGCVSLPTVSVCPPPPCLSVPPHRGSVSPQCSRSCGGGTKVRDVHCVDTRDQRLLRPFHCQAGLPQPPAQLPCHSAPCLAWYTSSWREVLLQMQGTPLGRNDV